MKKSKSNSFHNLLGAVHFPSNKEEKSDYFMISNNISVLSSLEEKQNQK